MKICDRCRGEQGIKLRTLRSPEDSSFDLTCELCADCFMEIRKVFLEFVKAPPPVNPKTQTQLEQYWKRGMD